MNTYNVTLAAGGAVLITGENYNADPVTGLAILDQFGNATKTFAPGSYIDIQIAEGAIPLPPVIDSTTITDGDL